MKKIVILFSILILLTACNAAKKEENKIKQSNVQEEIIKEKYVDENNTPIGLYDGNYGKFELVKEYQTDIIDGEDIAVFSIYPSQDENLEIDNRYGVSFYNKWISYPNYNNLKIGFNLKYTLNTGEEISFNMFEPDQTFERGFILSFLYDDYANRNSNWYSHVEQSEYSDDTLYTAIKLYANSVEDNINSKIILTVFTYDGLDDFDENGNYRGNSSYSVTICDKSKTC